MAETTLAVQESLPFLWLTTPPQLCKSPEGRSQQNHKYICCTPTCPFDTKSIAQHCIGTQLQVFDRTGGIHDSTHASHIVHCWWGSRVPGRSYRSPPQTQHNLGHSQTSLPNSRHHTTGRLRVAKRVPGIVLAWVPRLILASTMHHRSRVSLGAGQQQCLILETLAERTACLAASALSCYRHVWAKV